MSPAFRYSLARISVFLLCLLLFWLLGMRDNPLLLLIVATTVSMFISLFALRGMREQFADQVAHRVEDRTERKQAKAARRPFTAAGTLAKRFAAKEAFSKAVGTGFRHGVFMRDIGVVNEPSGKPTLALTGGARARLDALTPPGHAIHVHLTMTDDHPWAQAFMILEARKLER